MNPDPSTAKFCHSQFMGEIVPVFVQMVLSGAQVVLMYTLTDTICLNFSNLTPRDALWSTEHNFRIDGFLTQLMYTMATNKFTTLHCRPAVRVPISELRQLSLVTQKCEVI